jgi:predicted dehydrogenase
VRRLFGRDGLDETAEDACELYTHENGRPVNRGIVVEPDPTMGRVRSAANFVHALEGREAPLNTPEQALRLMKIIDALYLSARSGKPVRVR